MPSAYIPAPLPIFDVVVTVLPLIVELVMVAVSVAAEIKSAAAVKTLLSCIRILFEIVLPVMLVVVAPFEETRIPAPSRLEVLPLMVEPVIVKDAPLLAMPPPPAKPPPELLLFEMLLFVMVAVPLLEIPPPL